ncbi:MAG: hypothetical protein ACYC9L_12505 [Sulfuricaulis sp.]
MPDFQAAKKRPRSRARLALSGPVIPAMAIRLVISGFFPRPQKNPRLAAPGFQSVILFTRPDVTVIALATLVVIANDSFSSVPVKQSILIAVCRGRYGLRYTPQYDVDDHPVFEFLPMAEKQHGLREGISDQHRELYRQRQKHRSGQS